MSETTAAQPAEPQSQPSTTLRAYLILVGVGAFATTFAQQKLVGYYPTLFLLKDHMKFEKEQVSEFFLWATFAWNLKPLAGVLTDAFPLLGSRRRLYMLLGGLVAGLSWAALGFCTDNYPAFLAFSILLNIGIVFASTAMGGLQVEAGQAYAIPGRVSSLRQIVSSVCQVAGPLLGGWLAGQAYGLTAGIGAAVLLALAFFALVAFKEQKVPPAGAVSAEELARPTYKPTLGIILGILAIGGAGTFCLATPGLSNVGYSLYALLLVFFMVLGLAMARVKNPVLHKAQGQLSQILQSRTLWLAVVMLFLVYTVPGLATALTYRQSDELKFSEEFIGELGSIEGGAGLLFAFIYAAVCSRFNLRTLMVGSIMANALVTLLFLNYTKDTAIVVHAASGSMVVLCELALMDLAVRSTPRGCEALGFSLMMSIRNFGTSLSDVIGSKMMDQYHFTFNSLVWINAGTTAFILLFVPFLPAAVMLRKEGEKA